MTFTEFLTPQIVTTIVTTFLSIAATIAVACVRLLVNRFDNLASALKDQAKQTHEWLTDHEGKDQFRHEENLYRFEKIAVALARLGSNEITRK